MKKGQLKPLYVVITVFFILLVGITFVLLRLGSNYRQGLQIQPASSPQEYTSSQKKPAKKITIKKQDNSCIEVTPDGVVRIYKTCGGELVDAIRLSDPKPILELFKKINEIDLSTYQQAPATEDAYQLSIETAGGTQIITLNFSDPTSQTITTIVTTVIESIPKASPSPTPGATPLPGSSPRPSPTTGTGGLPSASASPNSTTTPQQPFRCNFSESGQNKPYRVSNVVCTDEPQPGE